MTEMGPYSPAASIDPNAPSTTMQAAASASIAPTAAANQTATVSEGEMYRRSATERAREAYRAYEAEWDLYGEKPVRAERDPNALWVNPYEEDVRQLRAKETWIKGRLSDADRSDPYLMDLVTSDVKIAEEGSRAWQAAPKSMGERSFWGGSPEQEWTDPTFTELGHIETPGGVPITHAEKLALWYQEQIASREAEARGNVIADAGPVGVGRSFRGGIEITPKEQEEIYAAETPWAPVVFESGEEGEARVAQRAIERYGWYQEQITSREAEARGNVERESYTGINLAPVTYDVTAPEGWGQAWDLIGNVPVLKEARKAGEAIRLEWALKEAGIELEAEHTAAVEKGYLTTGEDGAPVWVGPKDLFERYHGKYREFKGIEALYGQRTAELVSGARTKTEPFEGVPVVGDVWGGLEGISSFVKEQGGKVPGGAGLALAAVSSPFAAAPVALFGGSESLKELTIGGLSVLPEGMVGFGKTVAGGAPVLWEAVSKNPAALPALALGGGAIMIGGFAEGIQGKAGMSPEAFVSQQIMMAGILGEGIGRTSRFVGARSQLISELNPIATREHFWVQTGRYSWERVPVFDEYATLGYRPVTNLHDPGLVRLLITKATTQSGWDETAAGPRPTFTSKWYFGEKGLVPALQAERFAEPNPMSIGGAPMGPGKAAIIERWNRGNLPYTEQIMFRGAAIRYGELRTPTLMETIMGAKQQRPLSFNLETFGGEGGAGNRAILDVIQQEKYYGRVNVGGGGTGTQLWAREGIPARPTPYSDIDIWAKDAGTMKALTADLSAALERVGYLGKVSEKRASADIAGQIEGVRGIGIHLIEEFPHLKEPGVFETVRTAAGGRTKAISARYSELYKLSGAYEGIIATKEGGGAIIPSERTGDIPDLYTLSREWLVQQHETTPIWDVFGIREQAHFASRDFMTQWSNAVRFWGENLEYNKYAMEPTAPKRLPPWEQGSPLPTIGETISKTFKAMPREDVLTRGAYESPTPQLPIDIGYLGAKTGTAGLLQLAAGTGGLPPEAGMIGNIALWKLIRKYTGKERPGWGEEGYGLTRTKQAFDLERVPQSRHVEDMGRAMDAGDLVSVPDLEAASTLRDIAAYQRTRGTGASAVRIGDKTVRGVLAGDTGADYLGKASSPPASGISRLGKVAIAGMAGGALYASGAQASSQIRVTGGYGGGQRTTRKEERYPTRPGQDYLKVPAPVKEDVYLPGLTTDETAYTAGGTPEYPTVKIPGYPTGGVGGGDLYPTAGGGYPTGGGGGGDAFTGIITTERQPVITLLTPNEWMKRRKAYAYHYLERRNPIAFLSQALGHGVPTVPREKTFIIRNVEIIASGEYGVGELEKMFKRRATKPKPLTATTSAFFTKVRPGSSDREHVELLDLGPGGQDQVSPYKKGGTVNLGLVKRRKGMVNLL